jgi:hypothetical protein
MKEIGTHQLFALAVQTAALALQTCPLRCQLLLLRFHRLSEQP